MCPRPSMFNLPNSYFGNFILSPYGGHRNTVFNHLTNNRDVLGTQLRFCRSFSTYLQSMRNFMVNIVLAQTPFKISGSIITLVSIYMINFMLGRRLFTMERRGNQSMHQSRWFISFRQMYAHISVTIRRRFQQTIRPRSLTRDDSFNAPHITNCISNILTWTPFLIGQVDRFSPFNRIDKAIILIFTLLARQTIIRSFAVFMEAIYGQCTITLRTIFFSYRNSQRDFTSLVKFLRLRLLNLWRDSAIYFNYTCLYGFLQLSF